MVFLAHLILFVCIKAAIGEIQKDALKSAKPTQMDTRLDIHLTDHIRKTNLKVKNNETKFVAENDKNNDGTYINDMFKKPKQVETEIKSTNEDYHLSDPNLIINLTKIVTDNNRSRSSTLKNKPKEINGATKTSDPDYRIKENLKLKIKEPKTSIDNSKNISTNILTILSKKSRQIGTGINLNVRYKKPGDLGNSSHTENKGTRSIRSTNDVTNVSQRNNLLSLLLDLTNGLTQLRALRMSEQSLDMFSTIFESILSVLFGPNTHILWPIFVRVAVMILRLLTVTG